ncbi:DUF4142 domain-containing protein [Dyadobacter sp. 676]|uniref:DUF4142 domain-containing protein n=1 Tax=Dyadobacter sp. 676 TaxID=3088362 RepID=A0AAU8FGD6_9BACT
MKIATYTLITIICLSSLSCTLNEPPVPPEIDKQFVRSASDLNLLCMRAGETALNRSTAPDLRRYAGESVAFANAMNRELIALGWQKRIPVKELSDAGTGKIDSLRAEPGESFDAAFMEMVVTAHYDLVAVYEMEVASGQDMSIRAWARTKLPIIRENLEKAILVKDSI